MRHLVKGMILIATLLMPACAGMSPGEGANSDEGDSGGAPETKIVAGVLAEASESRPWVSHAAELYPDESFGGVAQEGRRYVVYRVVVPGLDVNRLDTALRQQYTEVEIDFVDTEYASANLEALVRQVVFHDRAYWRGKGLDVQGAGIEAGPRVSVRVRDLRPGMAEAMREHYSVPSISLYEADVILVPPG